jgi:chromosome segregation ATPase
VDVNTALVDDGLVEKEKIGGSNFFWSFPAKKDRMMQVKYEKTLQNIDDMKVKVDEASHRLADAKRGREDDDGERSKKLARLGDLAKERTALEKELDSLKENDPQALADLEKELKLTTEAAHRWTDNIFNCKDYLVKKRGLDKKEAFRMLQITANFDCKLFVFCICHVLAL